MCKTLATLIASNILLKFVIQAIIVERNLHSYYRLPTTTIKTSNASVDYYILQCPFKASVNIPAPKDMPVCLIVGRHSEEELKPKDLSKAKPRTVLNTQVDYRHLKPPPKLMKLVKIKNGKPYTMLLKPVNKKENTFKKITTFNKEPYKLFLTSPRTLSNQTAILYSVPLIQKLQINDSVALSSTQAAQQSLQTAAPLTTIAPEDNFEDESDEEDTQQGPLKYSGVQDTLRKFQHLPHATSADGTQYKSEKFFADSENFKKGFHSKGFQNMYHRDEIYQDHIFYDDLQQAGNYRVKEKLYKKQP